MNRIELPPLQAPPLDIDIHSVFYEFSCRFLTVQILYLTFNGTFYRAFFHLGTHTHTLGFAIDVWKCTFCRTHIYNTLSQRKLSMRFMLPCTNSQEKCFPGGAGFHRENSAKKACIHALHCSHGRT